MRIFVSEFICGGAWPGEIDEGSIAREGRAMLLAVAADFAKLPDCSVVSTWDTRLGPFPEANIQAVPIVSPDDESVAFRQLAAACDATLVIAPEFDGILTQRRRAVLEAGGKNLGPSPDATDLCSDKLATCRFLQARAIPTVDTQPLDRRTRNLAFDFPVVIKQRDGAGSLATFLLRDAEEWRRSQSQQRNPLDGLPMVQQPFVPGRAVSTSAVVSNDRTRVDVFPVGAQLLSRDGRFHYLGGLIPLRDDPAVLQAIQDTVRRACSAIDGLSSYVGFDLIVPEYQPTCPLIVDVNPRLTTSYVGYRQLACENLAARLLNNSATSKALTWRQGSVRFQPDGSISVAATMLEPEVD